jgi:tRNA(Glu) U13 pseudouridine synthase TruD
VFIDGWKGLVEPDDLHPGRYSIRLEFVLPKGAYATSFLLQAFDLQEPAPAAAS